MNDTAPDPDSDPRAGDSPAPRRSRLLANLVAAAIGVAILATGVAGVLLAPTPMPDFAMTVQSGKTMHLSNFRGKWLLVDFGTAHGSATGSAGVADVARVFDQMGPEAGNVRFLFISVDPRRDTPPVLGKYLARFDPAFIGANVPMPALTAVASEFGMTLEPGTSPPRLAATVDPRGGLSVVDPGGHLHQRLSLPLDKSDLERIMGLI